MMLKNIILYEPTFNNVVSVSEIDRRYGTFEIEMQVTTTTTPLNIDGYFGSDGICTGWKAYTQD